MTAGNPMPSSAPLVEDTAHLQERVNMAGKEDNPHARTSIPDKARIGTTRLTSVVRS
jgi:hypothetical protein